MAKKDGWGTGWMIISQVLGAALVLSLILQPGMKINWNAAAAIASASAAIVAVLIALMQERERRQDRMRDARAYALGLYIKLSSIDDALERFGELLNMSDADITHGTSKDLELAYSLAQSIDIGKLEVLDDVLVGDLGVGIQHVSRAHNSLLPEVGMMSCTFTDAHNAKTAFNKAHSRLKKLLGE